MTLSDIAAMTKPFIGAREAAAATGLDRYAINLCGQLGRPWMGCTVHFTGKRQRTAKIQRVEFLEKMGWKGEVNQ